MKKVQCELDHSSFSFDRLVSGVDNIRHDVFLSRDFVAAAEKMIFRLIAKVLQAERIVGLQPRSGWTKERDEFRALCREVLGSAVNAAKQGSEVQIDYLGQAAVVKLLKEEIRAQHDAFVHRIRGTIREYEMAYRQDVKGIIKLKEELATVRRSRKLTLQRVGVTLFEILAEVQQRSLTGVREANFGFEAVLSAHFFSNPMLFVEDPSDDFLMLENYILLGHRFDDPDTYRKVLSLTQNLLLTMAVGVPAREHITGRKRTEALATPEPAERKEHDILRNVENIDLLFDLFSTRAQYKRLKKKKASGGEIRALKKKAASQKMRLDIFLKAFKDQGVLKRIVAAHAMKPVYQKFCPPLTPRQVLEYLISFRKRKRIAHELKRLRDSSSKPLALAPLQEIIEKIRRVKKEQKRAWLLEFLKRFACYHRDLQNITMLREAMDSINLVSDENTVNLSRANNTLYEFLLQHEQVKQPRPYINHVIIKADVRGSTGITYGMKERGLNPASYFSLNFFDPITDLLPEYGAAKVFLEGDAVILAILEQQDAPHAWYSVARACGLAVKISRIVERCNIKIRESRFPVLELGIGISYENSPPTFLFDGDDRIMISPAINQADRLSGCSKAVRTMLESRERAFHLYVFQAASSHAAAKTSDEVMLRYNVNGIEMSPDAFLKLSQEIDIKRFEFSMDDFHKEHVTFYTGKFPTVRGRYQHLVIREAPVYKVDPGDLSVLQLSDRRYYEVCTTPEPYEHLGVEP